MSPDVIVLADGHGRGRDIDDAVRAIASSRVVEVTEAWPDLGSIRGVIVQASIDRIDTRRCLEALSTGLAGRRVPLVMLMRTRRAAEMRQAQRLGATACLSELADPTTVVAALFRQIAPDKTRTDLLVDRSVARAATLFSDMFSAATDRAVDLPTIDAEVDPVLQALRDGGLRRWLDLVRNHDDTTVRHCLLVAGVMANFVLYLGLSSNDRTALVRAALVHDVGKARIPRAILDKPASLDPAEAAVMRTHPVVGHEILLASGMNDPVALVGTRHHHELLDGSGYPDGLRGEQIGDAVRLLKICDIYAALSEHRPYRSAMTQAEALKVLAAMTPTKLDAALVEAFAGSLEGLTSPPPPAACGSKATAPEVEPGRRAERSRGPTG